MSEIHSAAEFPRRIQLQTHNLCNYACGMCPYPETSHGRKSSRMDDALYRRILAEIGAAQRPVKLCLMLQNEPLLDRRFVDLVAAAHEVPNIEGIASVSNGSRLDHETLDALAAFERFRLTVSINATDGRRYLQVHGRDRWDRIRDVLGTWSGDRSRVVVSCVVGADTIPEGNRFRRYWREQGYAVRLIPYSTRAGRQAGARLIQRVEADYGYCTYPAETLTVRWDGTILLCCQDWAHDQTFGSLSTATIEAVWNSDAMRSLRRSAREGRLRERASCKSCDYPMRSSERIALDHRLRGEPAPRTLLRTFPHRSAIRAPSGDARGLAVYGIDRDAGVIRGFVDVAPNVNEGTIEAWLCIGHRGEFVVDRPGDVWCGGRIDIDGPPRDDMLPVRITLDRAHHGYDYFGWYADDWRRA